MEGTTDYEWAFGCYQESVGIDPEIVFTDADPAATAAVQSIWPGSFHGWCLWHLYVNVTKALSAKLGDGFSSFLSSLKTAQRQLSETQFYASYEALKRDFPAAIQYLDEQLSPNVDRWAAYALETFTGGAESTQRGEGLNRHIKCHLDSRSSLMKVFTAVSIREEWEDARCQQAQVLLEVHAREQGSTARSLFPDIYEAAKRDLTTYALHMMCTQVQAAIKYQVIEDCEQPLDLDVSTPPDSQDPSLVDMPRYKSASELLEAGGGSNDKVLCVTLRRCLPGHLKNPHFIVLKQQVGQVYTDFWCSCGSTIRSGIPCRHYWAVLLSDSHSHLLGFHFGHINDLWFSKAQAPTAEQPLFCIESNDQQTIPHRRPLFQAASQRQVLQNSDSEAGEEAAADLRLKIGRKRTYGELLGLCKKAVEACVAEGTEDALRKMMQSFVPGGESPTKKRVTNPPVAKPKGRPKGALNKRGKENCRPSELASLSQAARPSQAARASSPTRNGSDAPAAQEQRKCGICKKPGHNRKNCPTLAPPRPESAEISLSQAPCTQAPVAPGRPQTDPST